MVESVDHARRAATERLRGAGSATPRLDAEVLLAHVTGRDRAWLLAHSDAPLSQAEATAYAAALDRRAAGEPVAYIRGVKEWWSLRLATDARALIPRPETEVLVDAAVDEVRRRMAADDAPIVLWEIGTGSGAVSVAFALRFREAIALHRLRLIASDASADALELTAENLDAHGAAALVDLALADLLEPAGGALPRPDVIVANLPYVPTADVAGAGRALAYEPPLALDGGADGLEILRRLLQDLPLRTARRSTTLLEIGAGQASAVRSLAPETASVDVVEDLAGIERVVRIDLAD